MYDPTKLVGLMIMIDARFARPVTKRSIANCATVTLKYQKILISFNS